MPLDAPAPALSQRIAALNARFHRQPARAVLNHALSAPECGRIALVSSFGAESVVLLHMLAAIRPATPVIFLDTEMLFAETLTYQAELSRVLGLTNLRVVRPDREALFQRDPDNLLHLADPDACCTLRKAEPLARALSGFDSWISGRKRSHGGQRAGLDLFEAAEGRLKINPLAHWTGNDIAAYRAEHALPHHPLVGRGFPSIGCAPCTSAVRPGEDPRAGRWRGADKTECGIHLVNGRMQRRTGKTGAAA